MSVQALRASALAAAALTPATAMAEWGLNLPRGVTSLSQTIYDLHMTIFWICVAIAVVVFGIMLWSIIAYRKSKGAKPATFHENTTIEIIWTAIPFVILIAMAFPATTALLDIYDTDNAEMDILVTGYQWRWRYEYLDDDVDFFSNLTTPQSQIENLSDKGENYLLEVDNPLVVPVNTRIRFLITANDVIHSWWVPEFGVKQDAIPGFINETWADIQEPGIYRGMCAELCGRLHAYMPIVVHALPEDEYEEWIAERREEAELERQLTERDWTMDELMERGQRAYASNCASCHMADGSGVPPTFPALHGDSLAVGDIAEHIDLVINGRGQMPAFGNQLNEIDLAAVITYTRNAWGNDTGDTVTPQDIIEFREQQ